MWANQGGFNSFDQGGFAGGKGDQGGGFINSPGNFGSPAPSQDKRFQKRVQNVMPCTVGQIMSATQSEDKFLVNGIEMHQITLVGLVVSVNETPVRLDYLIDDMTGPPLEVKQFVDNDENTPEEERIRPMRENTYVRVYGHIRSFQGKQNVVTFKMVPIMDMNELTTHILEVIYSQMSLQNMALKDQSAPNGMAPAGDNRMDTNQYAGAAEPDHNISGLSKIQQQVQMVIRAVNSEQGISISAICQQLRGLRENVIRDAIEFLSGEGHIYSTIDEDHYRSTDAMD